MFYMVTLNVDFGCENNMFCTNGKQKSGHYRDYIQHACIYTI